MIPPERRLNVGSQAARFTELVRQRGPDAGRYVDHLKERSLTAETAALLARLEGGGLAPEGTVDLTASAGGGIWLSFMLGWSALGGGDVLLGGGGARVFALGAGRLGTDVVGG